MRCYRAIRGGRGVAAVLAALLGAACAGRQEAAPAAGEWLDPREFDGGRALAAVREVVALGPRASGSPGAEAAANYLLKRLEAVAQPGHQAEIAVFEDDTPAGRMTFRNVLFSMPGGRSNWLIVASHYDTAPNVGPDFVGANDSGSSSGALLTLAEVLSRRGPPPVGVLLAFLDGEECMRRYGPGDGLHGSRRLLASLRETGTARQVDAFILLDMIGDRDLTVTVPANSTPALVRLALDAAQAEGRRAAFRLTDAKVTDDHVPFLSAGIPSLDLIDFEFGSAPGRNDYWHTPQDTLDKLSPESLQLMGRVVIRMLNALAEGAGP
jgi:glutaminyl-peptide cyclotransferase